MLGVKKDASPAEIKKVYFSIRTIFLFKACFVTSKHQLARKYHPDTNPDKSAKEKFLEIQEAYDVRQISFEYNMFSHTSFHSF